jgi:hypothetical protein
LPVPTQPGYLLETRGFPSPPRGGFGLIWVQFNKNITSVIVYIKQLNVKVKPFLKKFFFKLTSASTGA